MLNTTTTKTPVASRVFNALAGLILGAYAVVFLVNSVGSYLVG